MNGARRLIEDCCGWNRRTWADAVEFALSKLPDDLRGKRVLEIGAGKYSTIAPIFAAKGADVFCSFYLQPREEIENGHLRTVSEKYGLGNITVLEMDMHKVSGVYDIIILKSVLGGICRNGDYAKMRWLIDGLMKNLSDDGVILSMDNGHVGLFDRLRSLMGAGKDQWTYFRPQGMRSWLAGYELDMQGFGYLNFGTARFMLRRDMASMEVVNDAIYMVDRALLRLFNMQDRAVISTVIRKRNTRPALAMSA